MKINEFIQLSNLNSYKIHLAQGGGATSPLIAFWKGNFEDDWQCWQTKRNFERKFIFSLIDCGKDEWLFAGIYEVISHEFNESTKVYKYKTKLLNLYESLIGRLVIKYPKTFRNAYPNMETCWDDFYISEILKVRSSFETFSGYENVKLDFGVLKAIIDVNETSWKTALLNMKGVYLITNKSNGKLYVGSAYGENGIWSRWTSYVGSKHGGNAGLIQLLSDEVNAYEHFQFSILEIMKFTTSDNLIINREGFWKDVLASRQFGYNKN
jgi:GIY-YIG catalytic domain